jgi:glycosyltransferase involved in cell wall biosynthesis
MRLIGRRSGVPMASQPAQEVSGSRILMLCPQFRPLVGGYERAAERLAKELTRHGCPVSVVTERRQRDWPSHEYLGAVEVRRLACWYRPGWHLATSALMHAAWLLRHGRRFDVWHVHQFGTHATMAVLMGKLLGRRVVVKLTSSGEQGIDITLRNAPLAALQQWAHRRADAWVAVSVRTVEEACGFGIERRRVAHIPNGADTELFRPASGEERVALRDQLGLDRNAKLAVCVGRLADEKDPLGVVDAWALARQAFRERWILALVGDGPLRNLVAARVRESGIEDGVRIVGSSDRVQDWLRAADMFILGSRNEGMANTALEAMACGLPSVVTAVSGMDALMADTGAGIVVPPGDANALAHALIELHDDAPRRSAMGQKARHVVVRDYSITQVALRHLDLYARLRVDRRHE